MCGAQLSGQAQGPSEQQPAISQDLTALFADIQGSMELMEDLDPEEARRLVDPALAVMVEVVNRFEGYVVHSTGDGIFALFGAPIAHEDHPQRAIHAALHMQEEIRRYSERLLNARRLRIMVRVGINTGEVVVRTIRTGHGHIEYVPLGHPTSLAARLQKLASPGAVVVGESTRRATHGYFEFSPLAPARVKGVHDPVLAYEVVGLGPLRTRLEFSARRGLAKFVGRDSELEQLNCALRRARAGNGRMVGLVGEAGVGKSRLLLEFKLTTQGECRALEAIALPHLRQLPLLPIVDLLRSYFDLRPGDDEKSLRDKVRDNVVALDPVLEETIPYLNSLLGITGADDPLAQMAVRIKRQRTFGAIKRILIRQSNNQPLILVFEDLHWLDNQSLAFLDTLLQGIQTTRILVLATYRPEFVSPWDSREFCMRLRLDPLERKNAEEMLSALLGNAAEMTPLKNLIVDKTQGNPFFIEEIIQTLFDQGALVRNGEIKLASSLSGLSIPTSVQGIIASRIDRLRPAEKDLLQTLAVIGVQLDESLVRGVVPNPQEELDRMLNTLQRAEFISENPALAEFRYSFKHALTRDVAYNSVLIERRKIIHERTAHAIETLFPDRIKDHISELAYHYSGSGNVSKAVHYLRLAGQQASERSAVAEAVGHFKYALALVKDLPDDLETAGRELALLVSLGNVLMAARGFAAEELAETFRRAGELCNRIGETPRLVPALFGLWVFHNYRGESKAARSLGEQLTKIAQNVQSPEAQLLAHTAVGITSFYLGEFDLALQHCEQGATAGDLGSQPRSSLAQPWIACNGYAAIAMVACGCPVRGARRSRETLEAAARLSHVVLLTNSLVFDGVVRALLCDGPGMQQGAERLVALTNEHGFPLELTWATAQRGYALALQNKTDEAIGLLTEALKVLYATGALMSLTQVLCWLAHAYLIGGRIQEGLEAAARGLNVCATTGEAWYEAELHRLTGALLMNSGRPAEAEEHCHTAIGVAHRQGAKWWELRAANSLASLLKNQRRGDDAGIILKGVYGTFAEGFETPDLTQTKVLLAELGK
jgi:class 3 adenylate cyclase/predicted ATPase